MGHQACFKPSSSKDKATGRRSGQKQGSIPAGDIRIRGADKLEGTILMTAYFDDTKKQWPSYFKDGKEGCEEVHKADRHS